MFIFQNPKTKIISTFNNLSEVGMGFIDWINITDTDEAKNYLLQKAKDEKIAELDNYYSSGKCWEFTVRSEKLKASLTQEVNWFATKLPAVDTNIQILLTTAENSRVPVQISEARAKKLNNLITIDLSSKLRVAKLTGEAHINKLYSGLSDTLKEKTNEDSLEEALHTLRDIEVTDYFQNISRCIDLDLIREDGSLVNTNPTLREAKDEKIAEIKNIRDKKNIDPSVSKGELVDINSAHLQGSGKFVDFFFDCNKHPTNPLSEPTVLLSHCISNKTAIPYFAKNKEGESIVIRLTPELASDIERHLIDRNCNNFTLAKIIIKYIEDYCTTVEEVQKVTWDPRYLNEQEVREVVANTSQETNADKKSSTEVDNTPTESKE
jgi:hypothetical protein